MAPGAPRPARTAVRLNGLGRHLESRLLFLEQAGITSTRGWPRSDDPSVREALAAIGARRSGALCIANEPLHGQTPGVSVALGTGYITTGDPNTLAGRVELWLASESADNLRSSLGADVAASKHAVLLFDPATEPEHRSALERGSTFCPTAPIELPDEVDVVWLVIGAIACRFDRPTGWQVLSLPETGHPPTDGPVE